MRETKEKNIDGLQFAVTQMPVKRATKLMYRLARAGVPALLKAVSASKLEGLEAGGLAALLDGLDLSNMGEAALMLFDKFSEADFDHATNELLESATVDAGGNLMPVLKGLDVVITKPGTLMKAIAFSLEVNYGDFFGAFLAAAGTLAPKAAPQSKA